MEKTTRTWKIRAIALFLVVATAFTVVLTACGDDGDSDKSKTTTASATKDDGDSVTAQTRAKYAGTDFKGDTFTILGIESGGWWYSNFMNDSFNEIWYETDSADPLESAIYTRNRRTEDLINIEIKPYFVEGSNEVSEKVRTALSTGDSDYSLCLTSLNDGMLMAQEGLSKNILNIETIETENDWWDQNLMSAYTMFNDRQYLLSGAINVYDDMAVNMIMFNRDLITQLNLEDPYDLVGSNSWTIDKFAQMSELATIENGDNNWDINDTWGMWIGSGGGVLFSGFNLPTTANNEEGIPELQLGKEEYVNAALKLYETVFQSETRMDGSADTDTRDAAFADNRLLFYWIITCQLNRYRNMETEFGIVPTPKLDSSQKKYSGGVNQHFFSVYFIPSFVKDADKVGTIVEVMAALSVDTIYETTFVTMLGEDSKLLRDSKSKEMLDIVFSSRQYDYSILGLGDIGSCFSMDKWGSFMYESAFNTYKRAANAALMKIVTKYEGLE